MRKFSLLLLSLTLLLPGASPAQVPKDFPLPGTGATLLDTGPADYEVLAKYTYMMGKIIAVNPTSRSITFRVEYQVPQPVSFFAPVDENANDVQFVLFQLSKADQKELKKLQKELDKIQKIQDPVKQEKQLSTFLTKIQNKQLKQQIMQTAWVQQKMAKMAAKYAGLPLPGAVKPGVQMVSYAKEFILDVASDVIVARKELPLEYDEKGEVKTYKDEEKKAKIDPVIGGYKAKFEDLAAGQSVYVYFKIDKSKLPTVPDPDKTSDDKKDDKKPGDKKDDKKPGDNPPDKKDDKQGDAKPGDKKDDKKPDDKKPGDNPPEKKDDPKAGGKGIVGDITTPPSRPSNAPVVRAVLILTEPGIADSPIKKKKKDL